MDQLVMRYGLPGIPMLFVVFLVSASNRSAMEEIARAPAFYAAMFAVLAFLFGNFIQQMWMLLFELSPWRYDGRRRKVLREIKRLSRESNDRAIAADSFFLWETALYSSLVSKEIRDKDRKTWGSFHANRGNAIGFILGGGCSFGAAFCPIVDFSRVQPNWFFGLGWIFIAFGVLLWIKGSFTRRQIEKLEVFWARIFFYLNLFDPDVAIKSGGPGAGSSGAG